MNAGICSNTEYKAEKFIYGNNINYNINKIDQNVKFIVGNNNPMILVPGIYGTKSKSRTNCRNL